MTSLETAAAEVLALMAHYPAVALLRLDAAIAAGLPMDTARHLLLTDREGEAREVLEKWADSEHAVIADDE